MSRPRTRIRRMWGMGPNSLYRAGEKRRAQIEALDGCPVYSYLVIPETPAARAAMVNRAIVATWRKTGTSLPKRRREVEDILAAALTP